MPASTSTGRTSRTSMSRTSTTRWVATRRTDSMPTSTSTGCTGACTTCTSVPIDAWAAQMFGGEKEEYDAIRAQHRLGSSTTVSAASAASNFNAMVGAANKVASRSREYGQVRRPVPDAGHRQLHRGPALATGTRRTGTGPRRTGTRRIVRPDGLWRFHTWDAEHSMEFWNTGQKRPRAERQRDSR